MNLHKTIVFLSMLVFFFKIPALAIDIQEYGDFSSRSFIMNQLDKKDELTQEQKNILVSKKLTTTTRCLITQIEENNIDNVKLLLDLKVNPNDSYMSEYPIYVAAKENHFEIVKLLKEYGAKIDKGFFSELYVSLKNKNKEMAQYFIDNKANVNYKDSVTENTVLYMALKNKMYDIAKQLISLGARPDFRSVKYIKKHKLYNLIELK